jgi:ribosomal protein S17E
MSLWKTALREGAVTGTLASLISTAVLATAGSRQAGSAVAPTNAISHWLWGDESLMAQRPDLRHTVAGYVTHHLASVFWATLYSRIYGHRDEAKELRNAIAGGIATSATAYVVDYYMVPKRLTPGYEHRISTGAMAATYGALAAGFALGALLLSRLEDRDI